MIEEEADGQSTTSRLRMKALTGGSRLQPPRRNLAARAARWSANHRKLAIWGWLGFVVLAVLIGSVVTQDKIHGTRLRGSSAE